MLEIKRNYAIIRGPMGVGKTCTTKKLFRRLNNFEVPRAVIHFDTMRKLISDREPSYENIIFHTNNIVYLSNQFITKGYFTIIEGVIAAQKQLNLLKNNINGDYFLFRIDSDRKLCYERDRNKDRKIVCGEEKINKAFHEFEKNRDFNPEEILINNDFCSIEETVSKIISHL